jgi:phosphoribosylformylglycinamidine synthase
MAKVLVLKAAGINCDEETVHAFALAGADVELIHAGVLLRGERRFGEFDIFVVPGGFSYGDDLGAGTVLANQLRSRLADDIDAFVDEGKLVLGICNGFQVLVRLGILPGWEGRKAVSLIDNCSGHFEDRWIRMRVETDRCAFLAPRSEGGEEYIRSPVAHAEGRFVARDEETLARLRDSGQIALTYRALEPDEGGEFPSAEGAFPANPNGSSLDIAGICNERGNVLGLMPHPERFLHLLQDPLWTRQAALPADSERDLERAGDGFGLFARAVRFVDDAVEGDAIEGGAVRGNTADSGIAKDSAARIR